MAYYLRFEDEAVLRTDQPGTPYNWSTAAKVFDPNHAPVAQAYDTTKHIGLAGKDDIRFHDRAVLRTDEPGTPVNWTAASRDQSNLS
jgi:hypothetical protein